MNVLRAAVLAAVLLPAVSLAQESELIQFEIADQFDRKHTAADVRDRILLLDATQRRDGTMTRLI